MRRDLLIWALVGVFLAGLIWAAFVGSWFGLTALIAGCLAFYGAADNKKARKAHQAAIEAQIERQHDAGILIRNLRCAECGGPVRVGNTTMGMPILTCLDDCHGHDTPKTLGQVEPEGFRCKRVGPAGKVTGTGERDPDGSVTPGIRTESGVEGRGVLFGS